MNIQVTTELLELIHSNQKLTERADENAVEYVSKLSDAGQLEHLGDPDKSSNYAAKQCVEVQCARSRSQNYCPLTAAKHAKRYLDQKKKVTLANCKPKKRPLTGAERSKRYRERKREAALALKLVNSEPKKMASTSTERSRVSRLRKQMGLQHLKVQRAENCSPQHFLLTAADQYIEVPACARSCSPKDFPLTAADQFIDVEYIWDCSPQNPSLTAAAECVEVQYTRNRSSKKRPLTAAERSRNYRLRKQMGLQYVKVQHSSSDSSQSLPLTAAEQYVEVRCPPTKCPLTVAERGRRYRERKKKAEQTLNAVSNSELNGPMCFAEFIHVDQQLTEQVDQNAVERISVSDAGEPEQLGTPDLILNSQVKRRLTHAERMRNYRLRKQMEREGTKSSPRKRPLTAAERVQRYRERKKKAAQTLNADGSSELNGPMSFAEIIYVDQQLTEQVSQNAVEHVSVSDAGELEQLGNPDLILNSQMKGPVNHAERLRNYRQRKKLKPGCSSSPPRRRPLTGAERVRRYRERKKKAAHTLNVDGSSELNGPMSFAEIIHVDQQLTEQVSQNAVEHVSVSDAGEPEQLSNPDLILNSQMKGPVNHAERLRNYRQRKNLERGFSNSPPRKRPLTGAERMRRYRERKKKASQTLNADSSSELNGPMSFAEIIHVDQQLTEQVSQYAVEHVSVSDAGEPEQLDNPDLTLNSQMKGPVNHAKRLRNYRQRKNLERGICNSPPRKRPQTSAERMRRYRERKKKAAEALKPDILEKEWVNHLNGWDGVVIVPDNVPVSRPPNRHLASVASKNEDTRTSTISKTDVDDFRYTKLQIVDTGACRSYKHRSFISATVIETENMLDFISNNGSEVDLAARDAVVRSEELSSPPMEPITSILFNDKLPSYIKREPLHSCDLDESDSFQESFTDEQTDESESIPPNSFVDVKHEPLIFWPE